MASLLRAAGAEVRLVDATASRLSMDEVVARLEQDGFRPTLILFPTTTPTLDADVIAMAQLKARYGAPIFCFGPHASTAPLVSMERAPAVDGMFVGEPEDGALQLATLASVAHLADVPSLTWRQPGGPVVAHRAHGSFSGFMSMPFPAWDLLALKDYGLPSSTSRMSSSRRAVAAPTRATSASPRSIRATSSASAAPGISSTRSNAAIASSGSSSSTCGGHGDVECEVVHRVL